VPDDDHFDRASVAARQLTEILSDFVPAKGVSGASQALFKEFEMATDEHGAALTMVLASAVFELATVLSERCGRPWEVLIAEAFRTASS
jgi:hypothetical protein